MNILMYVLCGVLFVLTTTMFTLFFVNDRALRKEIEKLNSRIEYYIRTLKDRGGK